MSQLTRRGFTAAVLAAPAIRAVAADPILLRLSVESTPQHQRTISAADFCAKLEKASGGAIRTHLYPSGQLFNDHTVISALVQNQVEMSIPGNWGLAGFVPSVNVLQLPILYSRPIAVAHRVIDGKAGAMIHGMIEQKLRLKVLGRWLDLGFENWYSTRRPLHRMGDLKGMKIRNSGGAGKAWLTTFLGAIPDVVPWPDVALGLSQGTFDGLITTDETVASSSLWESGVHHSLEDHQSFNGYVPLVAGAFWNKLPAKLRQVMTETWESNVDAWRGNMARSQLAARGELTSHGVTVVVPDAKEIDALRSRMLVQQDQLVKQWRIAPEVAAQAVAAVRQGA